MKELTYEPIDYNLDSPATVRDIQNLLEKLKPLYESHPSVDIRSEIADESLKTAK